MKQVLQSVRDGRLIVSDQPSPSVQPGYVLIANRVSLISAGTEKMVRELARKSLVAKARSRPEQVRRVIEKVRQEGLQTTMQQVREKLGEPMPLGYCSAGVVLACGEGVQEFQIGELVASNGPHAGIVSVAKHLCARVPDGVPLDQAAFTVLGAIAMQGLRLSKLVLGESAFVIGLGLVGQITVALLKAAGVRVFGTDIDPAKCALAEQMGAAQARSGFRAVDIERLTQGLGADAVLITASTKSNGPIDLAANAVRQKGRIVLVGVVGLELDRRPFYFKEAEFVVSCSYGPGRYDPRYEEQGEDYPAAFVRWTQQRNMQAVLDLMAAGRLDLNPLVSHRFPIEQAEQAYELIDTCSEGYSGILLEYPEQNAGAQYRIDLRAPARRTPKTIGVGCLGAGNFARAVLLPKLCSLQLVRPQVLCSAGGLSATHCGKRLGFAAASSDENDVFENDDVDAAFILTRHDQHARQVIRALLAGKHVFVEKPLCLSLAELVEIEKSLREICEQPRLLMVGFNRRFSPSARAVRDAFATTVAPLTVSIRINAGAIPEDHWVQDEKIGGGRIIGEACHAIDLATYLTGSPVDRVFAESVGGPNSPKITDDQCFITMRHVNGSLSNVAYLAGGAKAFVKERVEVFGGGKTAVIDDFRSAELWSDGKRRRLWKGTQDKGHLEELNTFVESISKPGAAPISWEEIRATTLASILAVESLRSGMPENLLSTHPEVPLAAPADRLAG